MASSVASLSPVQRDQLHHFQAVVNLHDDAQALSILDNHNWNMEEAVGTALLISPTQSSSSPSAPTSSSLASRPPPPISTASSTRTTPTSSSYAPHSPTSSPTRSLLSSSRVPHAAVAVPPTASPNAATSGRHVDSQSWSEWLQAMPFGWVVSGAFAFLAQLLSAILPASWYHTAPSTSASSSSSQSSSSTSARFHADFMEQWPHAPPFLPSSYLSAIRAAKASHKLLFVYLHAPSSPLTTPFLRSTLCTEAIHNFVEQNFVAWMGSMHNNADAQRLAQSLRVRGGSPFIALLAPMQGQLAVMYRRDGGEGEGVDALIHDLLVKMEQYEAMTAGERKREEVLTEGRQLRASQDAEYQEALSKDREDQRRRQEQEQQRLRAEEQRQREAEEAKERLRAKERAKLARAQRRQELLASLPPEPASGAGVVAVSVRLMDGKKISRRWDDAISMARVFDWIDGQEKEKGTDWDVARGDVMAALAQAEEGVGVVRIVSNFPRKVHADGEASIKSLGLGKQVLLFVEEAPLQEE